MDLAGVVRVVTVSALAASMLGVGLRVPVEHVVASVRAVGPTLRGIAVNFALVPAITLAVLCLFDPAPVVWVAFLVLAACPGAPVSPPLAALAKGDVPYAVGQMVILSALSTVLSPVLLQVLLAGWVPGSNVSIDPVAVASTLVASQIAPLALGVAVQRGAPRVAARLGGPVGRLAGVLLVAMVALVVVAEHETLALVRSRGWLGMMLLFAASFALGWLLGGPRTATRRAQALTAAVRNASAALVVVSTAMPGTPAVAAVVAYALASMVAAAACALLFAAWHRGCKAPAPGGTRA
jgi:BASS family bile acid:Na+ symporter